MKYKAVYLELAQKDVHDIQNYLSRFYPGTPKKFLVALKQSIETLCLNPFMYEKCEGNEAYRRMVVMDYLVFCKVYEAKGIVEIHRILHGKREITAYLPQLQPV